MKWTSNPVNEVNKQSSQHSEQAVHYPVNEINMQSSSQ